MIFLTFDIFDIFENFEIFEIFDMSEVLEQSSLPTSWLSAMTLKRTDNGLFWTKVTAVAVQVRTWAGRHTASGDQYFTPSGDGIPTLLVLAALLHGVALAARPLEDLQALLGGHPGAVATLKTDLVEVAINLSIQNSCEQNYVAR